MSNTKGLTNISWVLQKAKGIHHEQYKGLQEYLMSNTKDKGLKEYPMSNTKGKRNTLWVIQKVKGIPHE